MKRSLYIMLAFLIALAGVPSLLQPAGAAGQEISEDLTLITGVEIRDAMPFYDTVTDTVYRNGDLIQNVRPDIDDFVAVIYDWKLSNGHSYTEGATYTFNLPPQFAVPNRLTGNLIGGIGEYVVETDGKTVFTFNDSINGGQGYEGEFYVWLQFNQSALGVGDGLKHLIDFSAVGQANIPVHFANTAQDGLIKSGKANRSGFNSDVIEWKIDFNQRENTIKNAKLTDTLPAGLTFGSIEIKELEVQLDGSLKDKGVVVDPASYTVTHNGNQFEIDLGTINKALRVIYTTSVEAPNTEPYTIDYTNNAVLEGDGGVNQSDNATVTVEFNEPLKKYSIGYDAPTQTITWKIEYNYNQQSISQADAWIEDTFDTAKFEYTDIEVYDVTLSDSGQYVSRTLTTSGYNVTDTGNGFKLEFTDPAGINSAYDIEYKMVRKSAERVYGNETIENTAEIHNGTKAEAARGIHQVIFDKSVKYEDFANKEIEWRLVVNQDKKEMTHIVIKESYENMHMDLIDTSIRVNESPNLDPFKLAYLPGETDYKKGFILDLIDPNAPITDQYVITFKTSFDPTAGMPAGGNYENTAVINWKESGADKGPISDKASVTPQSYTVKNGNKTGRYNALEKTITWTIDVNYNLFDISDAIIKDTFSSDDNNFMEFVAGSLTVNQLNLQPGNNQFTVGDPLAIPAGQPEVSGRDLTLKLGNIGKTALRIQYKTKLADEANGNYKISGSYSNQATLQDGESGPVIFNEKATVTPAHGGKYLEKTGHQVGMTDKAEWRMIINPSQSYVDVDSILTDTLSNNQILLADSIKLYHVQVPSDNSGSLPSSGAEVDEDDYELTVTGNTFTLRFNIPLTTAYLLEYESYINADDGETIGNDAEFMGQGAGVVNKNSHDSFKVALAGAGGGAAAGKGKLKIVKTDDENNPLPGVTFELWNHTGNVLLETLITDGNGEAETQWVYRYNATGLPYILKEVSAPSGYLSDPEYGAAGGKEIKFKDPGVPLQITNKKIRQGFELIKRDEDDHSKVLEGAEFELRDNGGNVKATLITGVDGRIAMGDLDPGNYTLAETKAPQFYELEAAPIPFTITADQTEIIKLTHDNKRGTGGKLTISKIDADDYTAIEGAEFELRDEAGNVVASGSTDVNGVLEFTNLEYGRYTLVETRADGYVIEHPERDITIESANVHLTIENRAHIRDVKLTKFNTNRSLTLPGAVFELWAWNKNYDLDGNEIYELVAGIPEADLTTDLNGELLLLNLPVNKYQLIETKAPSGYKLDPTPVEFEITADQTAVAIAEKTNDRIPSTGGGGGFVPPQPPIEEKPEEPEEGEEQPEQPEDPGEEPKEEPIEKEDPSDPKEPPVTPEQPTVPKEKTVTPENTPKDGKIEVPEEGRAEVGEKPKHGTVEVDEDGNWTYTPDEGFIGEDNFSIKVINKDGNEEEIWIEIDVEEVPRGVNKLPKTGESSHWPMMLTGLCFVVLGTVLLTRRYRLQQKI